jgi:hypothetical protein
MPNNINNALDMQKCSVRIRTKVSPFFWLGFGKNTHVVPEPFFKQLVEIGHGLCT